MTRRRIIWGTRFAVEGKIFATIGYPDEAWGLVNSFPNTSVHLISPNPEAPVVAQRAL